jgi:hypothetical protein
MDNSKELSQEIFNRFMDLLKDKNPNLYERVLDQNFLFIPDDKSFKILKSLKDVSTEEMAEIDSLLVEASESL